MLIAERRNEWSCVYVRVSIFDWFAIFIFIRIFIEEGGMMDFNFYSNFIPIYLYGQHKRTPLRKIRPYLILSLCSLKRLPHTSRSYISLYKRVSYAIDTKWKKRYNRPYELPALNFVQ